jgi:WD40 repeat protein
MNGGVHWIDPEATDRNRDVQHHHKGVYDLLPAGSWLFSAGGDGVLSRWSLETGRVSESYQLSNRSLRALARNASAGALAVGASDNHIYILDEATLEIRQTLTGAHANSVFALTYSPDHRYLLSGGRDAMLRIWDVAQDYALISEQPAHWFTINHIVYAPDGALFATASRDKTFRIWDARTFELLKTVDTIRYGGHINSVNRLLWLPDTLVSASDDRSLMLWRVG